jgi:hypothetical protein
MRNDKLRSAFFFVESCFSDKHVFQRKKFSKWVDRRKRRKSVVGNREKIVHYKRTQTLARCIVRSIHSKYFSISTKIRMGDPPEKL